MVILVSLTALLFIVGVIMVISGQGNYDDPLAPKPANYVVIWVGIGLIGFGGLSVISSLAAGAVNDQIQRVAESMRPVKPLPPPKAKVDIPRRPKQRHDISWSEDT